MLSQLRDLFAQSSYSKLGSSDKEIHDDEALLPKQSLDDGSSMHESLDDLAPRATDRNTISTRFLIFNGVFFCLSVFLFTASMLATSEPYMLRERNYLLKRTSEPSPILDLIDIPMSTKRLNGTFVEQHPKSIFRQPPSPEVDAAWERVETQTPIPITRQDVLNQGKDPSQAAKWPESFGFGPDAYIGRIDVFHQIHCLNRLRKHLHWNFDHYYGSERMNRYHELHVSHCLDILLQNLMCAGNVDVYPHFWADAQDNAFPDFSINHKCRDFDAILDWHDRHAVPLEEFGALRRPPGVRPRVMSHEFKEVFEWYDDEHPDDGYVGTEIA